MIWENNLSHRTVDDLTPSLPLVPIKYVICIMKLMTEEKKLDTPIKTPPKRSNKLLQLNLVARREWNKKIQFCSK